MTEDRTQRIIRICIWAIPVLLFAWIVNRNLVVFGPTVLRCSAERCDPRIKNLIARERELLIGTQKGSKERYRMFSRNPLSFTTDMFRPMQKAKVRLVYTGSASGNRLTLAASTRTQKDEVVEFADSSALVTTLESSWDAVRKDGVVLFQKRVGAAPRYDNVDDFLADLPTGRKIGAYHVDVAARIELPSYTPATSASTTKLDIRGPHAFVTYLGRNEDLDMTFLMQNSNRNAGKDNVTFTVYRGIDLMKTVVLKDDGTGKGDGKPSSPREVSIRIPRPGAGTYRVQMAAKSDDPFIRSITTRQKYLMWANRIYLAGSKEYRMLGDIDDKPITLYVKGSSLTASTSHESALQTITVGGRPLILKKTHTPYSIKLPKSNEFVPVTVPARDVALDTDGTFVLSKDAVFSVPSRDIELLTGLSDPTELDYVVASYSPVQHQGDWLVAEKTIEADLGRSIHFTVSFEPPIGAGDDAIRMHDLEVELVGGPITMEDVRKGIRKILTGGL